jgi:superfamily II DNA helicase RecQ
MGIKAGFYHGGMNNNDRAAVHLSWTMDEI